MHADIPTVIAGRATGRESDDEIILYDSTGTALQDAGAAIVVYDKALATGIGTRLRLAG